MKRKSLTQPATLAFFSFAALFSLTAIEAAAPAAKTALEGVKTVPGEIWKQTVSMSMEGFSMPGRTTEMCVPKATGQQDLYKSDKNCSVYDVQNAGNTFSAKMRCTGADAMEGTIQSTQEGNRTRGKATMRSTSKKGEVNSMEMTFDSTRTGQACEAKDYSAAVPPKPVAPPKGMDVDAFCRKLVADGRKDGNPMGIPGDLVWGKGAACAKPEFQKAYCSAAQSHAGFLSLDVNERKMTEAMKAQGLDAGGADEFLSRPLSASLNACGVAKAPAAVDALRAKLLGSAETQEAYDYLIYYGGDAEFAKAREVGKRECSGSAYTSAKNPKYAGYCNSLGLALALNNRKGAIAIIDGSCQGDGCGSQGAERSSAGASRSSNGGTAGNNGGQQPGAAPADSKEASKEAAKEAAKEAVDKGKRLLRGLLGGG